MSAFKILLGISIVLLTACEKLDLATKSLTEPKSVATQVSEAKSELDKKNTGNAIEIIIKIHGIDPKNSESYYLESQAESLKGNADLAVKSLEKSLILGFKDFKDIEINSNLDAIRNTEPFSAVIEKYQTQAEVSTSSTDISAGGDVSIKESKGKQVIKAGDVSISIDN